MSEKSLKVDLPEALLGLPNISIIDCVVNEKGEVFIKVESTTKDIPCRKCGKATNPHGNGVRLFLRHLAIWGRCTYIDITPRRGVCHYCEDHPTTTEQPEWYERKSKYTKAYEDHLLLSLTNSTLADVSIKEDVGYDAIQGIVDRKIASEMDWNTTKDLGVLGIDEISLMKGYQHFVTLITSRVDSKVKIIGVLKGKDKQPVCQFLCKIPKHLRWTIVAVCTDVCDGYINAVKETLGQEIPVVIDRFHVAQLYRRCFVRLRKSELARLRKKLSPEEYKTLKPAIAIMCQNKSFTTSDENRILETLFKHSPSLRIANKLCCKLTSIYNTHMSIKKASNKVDKWIALVESSHLTCFNTFVKTLRKHKTEILNYFRNRLTCGFVEGLNNKIKVLKRRCYGIYDLKHLFQRISLDLSGYEIFKQNQGSFDI